MITAYLCFIELTNKEHYNAILWENPENISNEDRWLTVEVVHEKGAIGSDELIEVRQTRIFNPRHIIEIVPKATTEDSSKATRDWEKVIKTEVGPSIKNPEDTENEDAFND